MSMPSRLRQLLQSERVIVAPVCYDPLTARLVESLGFKAAYLGGFSLGAVTYLTEPLTNMSEMAEHARRIARRINVPLIIDGNAGFSEPIHTIRAIQEFEWGALLAPTSKISTTPSARIIIKASNTSSPSKRWS